MQSDEHRFPYESAWQIENSDKPFSPPQGTGDALAQQIPERSPPRGSELFFRPELARPWRTSKIQKYTEIVTQKERQIEDLNKKCATLQKGMNTLGYELERARILNNKDTGKFIAQKDNEIRRLTRKIDLLASENKEQNREYQRSRNFDNIQQESEKSVLVARLQRSNILIQEMSNSFGKQIDSLKIAATNEAVLLRQIDASRADELVEQIRAANEATTHIVEQCATTIADNKRELERTKECYKQQLQEQLTHFQATWATMDEDKKVIEGQRDSALTALAHANEKIRLFETQRADEGTCFRNWNKRILMELQRITVYCTTSTQILGVSVPLHASVSPQHTSEAYVPFFLSNDITLLSDVSKICELFQYLNVLKQCHTQAVNGVVYKLKGYEDNEVNKVDAVERKATELDFQYSRLLGQTQLMQKKVGKLSAAIKEIHDLFSDTERLLSSTLTRLNFYNLDLQRSIENPTNLVKSPHGIVAVVVIGVEGIDSLWNANATAMSVAMTLLNQSMRAKLAECGGYEAFYSGQSTGVFLCAFQDPTLATRFALDLQSWTLSLPWPVDLLHHYHTSEEVEIILSPTAVVSTTDNSVKKKKKKRKSTTTTTSKIKKEQKRILFRGLRLQVGLNVGETGIDASLIPSMSGEGRARYYGKVPDLAMQLASMASGGMILTTSSVWGSIKETADAVSFTLDAIATSFGKVALDEGQTVVSVMQLTPQVLVNRKYHKPLVPISESVVKVSDDKASGEGDQKSEDKRQQIIVPADFSESRTILVESEIKFMTERYKRLARGLFALECERSTVNDALNSLRHELFDIQIMNKASTPEIVTQAAGLDRLEARVQQVEGDIHCVNTMQKELAQWVRTLESALSSYTRATLVEDGFKRRLTLVEDKANEKNFQMQQKCQSIVEKTKEEVARLEGENQQLKIRLSGPLEVGGNVAKGIQKLPTKKKRAVSASVTSNTSRTRATSPRGKTNATSSANRSLSGRTNRR